MCILCSSDTPIPPPCADGDFRLYDNYTNSISRDYEYVEEFNGLLEICFNGSYHGVCSGDYNEQEIAEVVCSSLGYSGSMLWDYCTECSTISTVTDIFNSSDTSISTGNNYDAYSSNGINDIFCPGNFQSLSQCSFSFSNSPDDDCYFHYNDLFITCTNSKFYQFGMFLS